MNNNLTIQQFNSYFAFILGREQKIALAELQSVLRRFGICFDILSLQHNIAIIKMENAPELINILGGTVSIYEIIKKIDFESLEEEILKDFLQSTGKNFSISDYTGKMSPKTINDLGIKIKIKARKNRSVRFVTGNESELNSATLYHKIVKTKGEAYGLFISNNDLYLGHLLATTSPDEWSRRDYGKPAGDKFSGMTPPKLARMLVNLALGQIRPIRPISQIGPIDSDLRPLVVDPFCGSGNILMEAAMLGCYVAGSDISEKAVEDAKANINWLMSNYKCQMSKNNGTMKQSNNNFIFQADATSYNFNDRLQTTGDQRIVVVTEPFLGKPKKEKAERGKVQSEVEELKSLYLSFLNNLSHLKSLSLAVVVFPLIETTDGGRISLFDECIDEIKKLGYNPIESFIYGRDYQIVKREIAVLTQQKS